MEIMTEHKPALRDLVREAYSAAGSYNEMERRARRAGHEISHTYLQWLARGEVKKAPDIEQMRAIAAAIDKGYETVRSAMFEQWYGYVPRELARREGSRITAAIPPSLSPEEERELLRMIRAWVASQEDTD